MRRMTVVLAVVVAVSSVAGAQENKAATTDRVTVDVGGGASRFGPHGFGGLEMAMNRWLAVRGEALLSSQSRERPDNDRAFRSTALSLTGVLTPNRAWRVSPYVFGGFTAAVSQGHQIGTGPLAGGGLRVRLGRFEPFVEGRIQAYHGVPISLGIRF